MIYLQSRTSSPPVPETCMTPTREAASMMRCLEGKVCALPLLSPFWDDEVSPYPIYMQRVDAL